jgi:hypothetical protein
MRWSRREPFAIADANTTGRATCFRPRLWHMQPHDTEFDELCRRIGKVMKACDVVLVPALDEPFGRTAIEAAAAGVPTIVSDKCDVLRDRVNSHPADRPHRPLGGRGAQVPRRSGVPGAYCGCWASPLRRS